MAAPQQIERARLHSACTSFYALVAGHGVDGDEGLVQSLVETGDGLPQVFALLHNHLRLALGKSHRRGDRPRHIGTAEGADRVGALRIVQLVDVGIIEAWEEVLVTAFLQEAPRLDKIGYALTEFKQA